MPWPRIPAHHLRPGIYAPSQPRAPAHARPRRQALPGAGRIRAWASRRSSASCAASRSGASTNVSSACWRSRASRSIRDCNAANNFYNLQPRDRHRLFADEEPPARAYVQPGFRSRACDVSRSIGGALHGRAAARRRPGRVGAAPRQRRAGGRLRQRPAVCSVVVYECCDSRGVWNRDGRPQPGAPGAGRHTAPAQCDAVRGCRARRR